MKKVLALILALTMVLSLGTVAMASNSTVVGGTGNSTLDDVVVKVTEGGTTNVYYITIEWDNMVFSYSNGGKRWDAVNHEYDTVDAAWVGGNTANIVVTNRSDVNVSVGASVSDKDAGDHFKAELFPTSFDLTSYAAQPKDSPASNSFTLTVNVDGVPSATDADGIVIGTITVIIAKKV